MLIPQHPAKPKIRTQGTSMFFVPSKSRKRAKIQIVGVPKTYPYQIQDAKPQSGSSSIMQSSKSGLKGHGYSFHF